MKKRGSWDPLWPYLIHHFPRLVAGGVSILDNKGELIGSRDLQANRQRGARHMCKWHMLRGYNGFC